MKKKKFTLIIPAYNCENSIKKCLESVLSQSFKDYEIILMNDESKDNTGLICKEYADKYPCIRFFDNKNKGCAGSRNFAMNEKINGEYVSFIDADDYLEPNALSDFNDAVTKYPNSDIIISKVIENGNKLEVNIPDDYKILDKDELLTAIFNSKSSKYRYVETVWAKVYKASFLKKGNYAFQDDLRLGEDLFFNLYAYNNAIDVCFMNKFTYNYSYNPESLSNSYSEGFVKDYDRLFAYLLDIFKEANLDEKYIYEYFAFRQIKRFIHKFFIHYSSFSEYKKMRRLLKETLSNPVYKKGILNTKISMLNRKEKITYFLCYLKLYDLILVLYKITSRV